MNATSLKIETVLVCAGINVCKQLQNHFILQGNGMHTQNNAYHTSKMSTYDDRLCSLVSRCTMNSKSSSEKLRTALYYGYSRSIRGKALFRIKRKSGSAGGLIFEAWNEMWVEILSVKLDTNHTEIVLLTSSNISIMFSSILIN